MPFCVCATCIFRAHPSSASSSAFRSNLPRVFLRIFLRIFCRLFCRISLHSSSASSLHLHSPLASLTTCLLSAQTGDSESGVGELKVWRSDDWSEEARLALPMANVSSHMHSVAVSRLHWSPDGQVRGEWVSGWACGALL